MSEETGNSAENPREILIEQIAQALGIVDDEHERRQVPNVNDDYTNEMMWVSDTLVAARDEIERLGHRLMLAESALGEIRAYYESGWGNLGEIIEHYQENEQVEMPNAFDEPED